MLPDGALLCLAHTHLCIPFHLTHAAHILTLAELLHHPVAHLLYRHVFGLHKRLVLGRQFRQFALRDGTQQRLDFHNGICLQPVSYPHKIRQVSVVQRRNTTFDLLRWLLNVPAVVCCMGVIHAHCQTLFVHHEFVFGRQLGVIPRGLDVYPSFRIRLVDHSHGKQGERLHFNALVSTHGVWRVDSKNIADLLTGAEQISKNQLELELGQICLHIEAEGHEGTPHRVLYIKHGRLVEQDIQSL